jgi:hypothetical protein
MTETTTIRIKRELYETVKSLAKKKKEFFANLNAVYGRLTADPSAWAAEQAEREEWDATLR